MTITGLDRAQAAYDNMEPPAERECYCLRWRCENCLVQYGEPGVCPDPDCREAGAPQSLAELPGDYLWEGRALVREDCPEHGGCQCGDGRCRVCG